MVGTLSAQPIVVHRIQAYVANLLLIHPALLAVDSRNQAGLYGHGSVLVHSHCNNFRLRLGVRGRKVRHRVVSIRQRPQRTLRAGGDKVLTLRIFEHADRPLLRKVDGGKPPAARRLRHSDHAASLQRRS